MADHALKTALGGAATGAAVGAVGGPWGALIGGGIGAGAGLLSGLFGGDDPSGYATARGPTAEQARRFAATEARREEASRLYGRLGGAAARGVAQGAALACDGLTGGARMACLREGGKGSEAAMLEGDIAGVTQQQAISREAQLEKKRVEMVKLANQLRKSGADPKEVARVMEGFAGGDPELRKIAASEALATDRGGLGGFLEGVTDWFTA